MNNDNEANANDNGNELYVGLPKWKGKNCCAADASLNTNVKCYSKKEHNCFWNDSDNYCYWSKYDCSGNKSSNSISFKMMSMLVWSESREGDSYLTTSV